MYLLHLLQILCIFSNSCSTQIYWEDNFGSSADGEVKLGRKFQLETPNFALIEAFFLVWIIISQDLHVSLAPVSNTLHVCFQIVAADATFIRKIILDALRAYHICTVSSHFDIFIGEGRSQRLACDAFYHRFPNLRWWSSWKRSLRHLLFFELMRERPPPWGWKVH